MSHEYVRPTGRPPGSKPIHLLYGVLLAVAWLALAVFVLTRGHGDRSSVDVYSELPPAFTNQLAAQGVLYSGLSPVDSATEQQVLAHAPAPGGGAASGSSPIVLRTTVSDSRQGVTDQAALMVVVPYARSTSGSSAVFVAFLDPATYRTLTTVTYATSGASSGGPG